MSQPIYHARDMVAHEVLRLNASCEVFVDANQQGITVVPDSKADYDLVRSKEAEWSRDFQEKVVVTRPARK